MNKRTKCKNFVKKISWSSKSDRIKVLKSYWIYHGYNIQVWESFIEKKKNKNRIEMGSLYRFICESYYDIKFDDIVLKIIENVKKNWIIPEMHVSCRNNSISNLLYETAVENYTKHDRKYINYIFINYNRSKKNSDSTFNLLLAIANFGRYQSFVSYNLKKYKDYVNEAKKYKRKLKYLIFKEEKKLEDDEIRLILNKKRYLNESYMNKKIHKCLSKIKNQNYILEDNLDHILKEINTLKSLTIRLKNRNNYIQRLIRIKKSEFFEDRNIFLKEKDKSLKILEKLILKIYIKKNIIWKLYIRKKKIDKSIKKFKILKDNQLYKIRSLWNKNEKIKKQINYGKWILKNIKYEINLKYRTLKKFKKFYHQINEKLKKKKFTKYKKINLIHAKKKKVKYDNKINEL